MKAATKKVNYAIRDQSGQVALYVLLWKRKGISLELFDDYWRNVHGPLCGPDYQVSTNTGNFTWLIIIRVVCGQAFQELITDIAVATSVRT